jgi:hypothetical protein
MAAKAMLRNHSRLARAGFAALAAILALTAVEGLIYLHNYQGSLVTGNSGASLVTSDARSDWGRSTRVVDATVVAVGAPVWSTPDGHGPTLDDLRHQPYQYGAYTPVTFQEIKVYKGNASGAFVLWIPGGNPPGPLEVTSNASAVPPVGSRAVLFLGNSVDWRFGHGEPLSGASYLQECRQTSSGKADCGSYSLAFSDLLAGLDRLAAGR